MKNVIKPLKIMAILCLLGVSAQLQAAITVTGFTVNERDGTGSFFINRGFDYHGVICVDWATADGNTNPPPDAATAGADYTSVADAGDPCVDIYEGSSTEVPVPILQDTDVENSEDLSLVVTLNEEEECADTELACVQGVPVELGVGQGIIEDDDVQVTVTISVPEGTANNVTVKLTCDSGDVWDSDDDSGASNPLYNSQTADTGGNATFLVSDIADGPLNCQGTIEPANVPPGYTIQNAAGEQDDCQNLEAGETCDLVLVLNSFSFYIDKVYTDGSGAPVTATLDCNPNTIGPQGADFLIDSPIQVFPGSGPYELSVVGYNEGNDGDTDCWVSESNLEVNYYQVSVSEACSVDDLPASGGSRICTFTNAPTRTTFEVNKVFSDDAETPVMVEIDCNTGAIPDFQKTIHPDDDPWEIKWIITDFNSGELNCTVSEVPLLGYEPHYTASLNNQNDLLAYGQWTEDEDGCQYAGAIGGEQFRCEIVNELQSVEVEVTKKWFDEHPEFNNSWWAKARWECANVRYETNCNGYCEHGGPQTEYGYLHFSNGGYDADNEQEESFWVFPNWDVTGAPTVCEVSERVKDSSVASDDSDCEEIALAPGVDGECLIVNTRIYEGIPTLSQYGLALLALLMLGVGLIGFRRFA